MKKFLKIAGIFVFLLLIFLAVAPSLFKGSLEKMLQRSINENLNAKVSWAELDLSLFSSFPDAALSLKDFSILNNEPFEGDTLVSGKSLKLDMGITQLFKKRGESIVVDALFLDEALVNFKIDSAGNTNYDIAIKKDSTKTNKPVTKEEGFTFDLQKYTIKNSRINYLDEASETFLVLTDVYHQGRGDLSAAVSKLETKTETLASLRIGDTQYLNENNIGLDADFEIDLENNKYTFLENEARLNELPLTFDGFIQINENSNDLDLSFTTPSSDFRNFLAVIPKTYVKELDGISTTGNFSIDGELKGIIDDTHIPKMDIKIASDNASFKYPDLPKAVRNIAMNVVLKNETGFAADTYLTIGGMTFKIDDEILNVSGSIKNLTKNALINLALKGTLNLANIEKVLPIELDQALTGVFKADVVTNFDMQSLDKERYGNIKSNGTASLTGFTYRDEAFKDQIRISKASINMSPGNIRLNELEASTGQTDIKASGDIQNLIPWIMAKQDLKGRFDVQSNTFNVNDFMTSEENTMGKNTKSSEGKTADKSGKIPDFLDATMNFTAKKVIYDNIVLDNAKGTVGIKNETANFSNVTSNIFGGEFAFSGNVNTKEAIPTFGMILDLKQIDINQSFENMQLLKYIAPIAKALDGNINTVIRLNGVLNEDLTPNLATITGDALAQILSAEVNTQNTPILAKLSENMGFLNLDKLSLRNLSTALTFNDGKIEVKPFDFNIEDVKVTAGGSHGLDKSINYSLNMNVPARYLGSDINKLLAKLDPAEANAMTVDLPVGLKGSFTSPQISVNTKAAVNSLTKTLIEKQKQELLNRGTNILEDLVTGGSKPKDSANTNSGGNTTQEVTTQVVQDIFGNLFGKKKKQDTTKTGN